MSPAHVNVVNEGASAASTEAAQQGEQPKTKKEGTAAELNVCAGETSPA